MKSRSKTHAAVIQWHLLLADGGKSTEDKAQIVNEGRRTRQRKAGKWSWV